MYLLACIRIHMYVCMYVSMYMLIIIPPVVRSRPVGHALKFINIYIYHKFICIYYVYVFVCAYLYLNNNSSCYKIKACCWACSVYKYVNIFI
jgi:hypothetical protein